MKFALKVSESLQDCYMVFINCFIKIVDELSFVLAHLSGMYVFLFKSFRQVLGNPIVISIVFRDL